MRNNLNRLDEFIAVMCGERRGKLRAVASAEAQPESTRNFGEQAATTNEHSAADAATEDDNRKRTQRMQRTLTEKRTSLRSLRSFAVKKNDLGIRAANLVGHRARRPSSKDPKLRDA